MCAPLLNRLVALILTVALTVMGVAAASARGQTTVDGHALAHCSAGGLVQPTLDAKGHPTGGKHLCPDLAAGLFATAAMAAADTAAPALFFYAPLDPVRADLPAGSPNAVPQARGPPVSL